MKKLYIGFILLLSLFVPQFVMGDIIAEGARSSVELQEIEQKQKKQENIIYAAFAAGIVVISAVYVIKTRKKL